MSPATAHHKAGLILAAVVFVLGLTAASAFGWDTQPTDKGEKQEGRDHGDKKQGEKGQKEEEGEDKEHEQQGQERQQPTVTIPVQPAQPAPAPSVAPSPPVTPTAPPQPSQPVGARGEEGEEEEGPVLAQERPAEEGAAIAPVSERQKLARTGLDPALIALLGAISLGGGILLFRRALAR